MRGDLRYLCGNGVAQGVTFSLLTQRVGNRDDFFINRRQIVTARDINHSYPTVLYLLQDQRRLGLRARQDDRRA